MFTKSVPFIQNLINETFFPDGNRRISIDASVVIAQQGIIPAFINNIIQRNLFQNNTESPP